MSRSRVLHVGQLSLALEGWPLDESLLAARLEAALIGALAAQGRAVGDASAGASPQPGLAPGADASGEAGAPAATDASGAEDIPAATLARPLAAALAAALRRELPWP